MTKPRRFFLNVINIAKMTNNNNNVVTNSVSTNVNTAVNNAPKKKATKKATKTTKTKKATTTKKATKTKTKKVAKKNANANNVKEENVKANNVKEENVKANNVKEENVKANNMKENNANNNKNGNKNNNKNVNNMKNNNKNGNKNANNMKEKNGNKNGNNGNNDGEMNMTKYFPLTKDVDKLQLAPKGRRAITLPDDAELITGIITEYVKTPKTKVITDATAGYGGNTINFAGTFKSVNAVENDKETFDMLKNNVEVFKLKNVELINDDFVKVAGELKQDVTFIDAPHGDKKFKFERLRLSDKFLTDILNGYSDNAKHVVLKVPNNFDYGNFMHFIKYKYVDIRKIPDKHWMLVVIYN